MTNTPSINNLLGKSERPEVNAIVDAFKADLTRVIRALADKHSAPSQGWPTAVVNENVRRISLALGADLLADAVDTVTLEVVKAAIACENVQHATAYGEPHDYETPAATLVQAADDLATHTCDTCRDHVGEAA